MLPLTIRKRTITVSDLDFIQKVIHNNRNRSRTEISKALCRKWNWRQPNGRLKDMACREILIKLHRSRLIDYPAGVHDGRNKERNKSITSADIDTTPIIFSLSQLESPRLILVRGSRYEPLIEAWSNSIIIWDTGRLSAIISNTSLMSVTGPWPAWAWDRLHGPLNPAIPLSAGIKKQKSGTCILWPTMSGFFCFHG
jgi:hypothetical protein